MTTRISSLIVFLIFLAGPAQADKDIDQAEAQALREQGVILPLADILENIQKTRPGRIMEVELEKKYSRYIYEIEIADSNGKVWELKIDASNGALISQEQDD